MGEALLRGGLESFLAMKIKLLLAIGGIVCYSACTEPSLSEPEPLAEFYPFNIKVDQAIPNSPKVDMVLETFKGDSTWSYTGRIETRGGFSISFPKQSFEIDLEIDVPLAGLPADDDWILNANYIDKTFIRHVIAYDLFRAMNTNHVAPKTKYIELSLNGNYNGLYVLMEKLDRSSLAIDKEDPTAVVYKEPPLFQEGMITPQDANNYYQQTYPKKKKANRTRFISAIRAFILNSDSSSFEQEVGGVFDLNNIVDWHLILLLTNNSDGILKNFYLYKVNAATSLRIAPWDYDHSWGRDGDNELNLIKPLDLNRSLLFRRLLTLPSYKMALKERWNELQALGLFTPAGLKQRIQTYRQPLDEVVARNFEKWPVDNAIYYDKNDFAAEMEIIERYIDLRHPQLVQYFENL